MSDLPLDDNGLPLPGREMDYYIATGVLGQKEPVRQITAHDWFAEGWERVDKFDWVCRHPVNDKNGEWTRCWAEIVWPAHYSTTHASYQVMQAMRARGYRWQIEVRERYVEVRLRTHSEGWDTAVWHESDIETAVAEGVCQITWKALSDA